MMYDMNEHVMC